MKTKALNNTCSVCGKGQKTSTKPATVCGLCQDLIETLRNDEKKLENFCGLLGIGSSPALSPRQVEQELPEVLDAVRYRTTDRERNTWYVSVSELDGEPVEIFASTAFDRDQHLQSRISNLTTITRLISLILRHIFMGERLTLEKTLTQLKRSSRQGNDLPDMLGNVLANYSRKTASTAEKDAAIP